MKDKKVLFVTDGSVSGKIRAELPAEEVCFSGYSVQVIPYETISREMLYFYDVFFFVRPIHRITKILDAIREQGKRAYVSVDDDFFTIPETNPCYNQFGPGSLMYGEEKSPMVNYRLALQGCSGILCASRELVERYSNLAATHFIPNCWSKNNQYWEAPGKEETGICNFGWAGTTTHVEDWEIIRKQVEEVVNSEDLVTITIMGDKRLYDSLEVKRGRKLFLPWVHYELYPYLLNRFDVLLAPLATTRFNIAKSDIKAQDAGVKGIPWIGSNVPPYQEWLNENHQAMSGFIANTNAWEDMMKAMTDPKLRATIGKIGKECAEKRSADNVVKDYYIPLIEEG